MPYRFLVSGGVSGCQTLGNSALLWLYICKQKHLKNTRKNVQTKLANRMPFLNVF